MNTVLNHTLQLLGSSASLANKILLNGISTKSKWYFKNHIRLGWALGLTSTFLLTPWVIQNHFWTILAYHASSVVLQSYGIFLTTEVSNKLRGPTKLGIKITIVSFALVSCLYLGFQLGKPNFGLLQMLVTFLGLTGTLLLAFPYPVSKICGWSMYIPAHCIYIVITLQRESWILAAFQLTSIAFAIRGIQKERTKLAIQKQEPYQNTEPDTL